MTGDHPWREADTHHSAVLAVLGEPPPWLIRWGITAVFLGVVVLLATSLIVRWPETVTAAATLSQEPGPRTVTSDLAGVLELLVADDDLVETGEPLATIRTSTGAVDLVAPTSGRFALAATDQESLAPGELIGKVLPLDAQPVATLWVPSDDLRRVQTSQQVRVWLKTRPDEVVFGQIEKVSPVAFDGRHRVEITFPDGLVGSTGELLETSTGVAATTEILVAEDRLWDRFFGWFAER